MVEWGGEGVTLFDRHEKRCVCNDESCVSPSSHLQHKLLTWAFFSDTMSARDMFRFCIVMSSIELYTFVLVSVTLIEFLSYMGVRKVKLQTVWSSSYHIHKQIHSPTAYHDFGMHLS